MYELEFIPKNKNEESSWLTAEKKFVESTGLTQDLLDFIEHYFEDDISDFETVIVYEEECYNLPVKIIKI